MKRRIVHWTWENPDAQQSFAEWRGFDDNEETAQQVDQIEALLNLRPPRYILDVGCGTGRHALEMTRRGYRVVGIDVATSYLEQAKRRARELGLDIEFRLQRGSELREVEAYDLALAYNHTLGFMDENELAQHMACIWATLKPGGRFLFHYAGPRLIPGMPSEPVKNWAEKEGRFILSEKAVCDGYRTEYCIVIDTVKQEIIEYHERQRAFALGEVKALLEKAGFERIECLADWDRTPATPKQFRLFVCGKGMV